MAPLQRLPTIWQVITYLFGVCLFSISFLVFLNSSVSFVITDIIGQKTGVGDAVGNLGFADELVAIVACPIWGMLSDRLGVRIATNVYPQLLLARMFFALGAAACTTMVTATLPSISAMKANQLPKFSHPRSASEASDVTVTPANWSRESLSSSKSWYQISGSRLAGFVGAFTGCGALIALTCFLPLPSFFQKLDQSPASALRKTYYIIGAIAFFVSLFCFLGLRNLKGQENKGWHNLWVRLSSTRGIGRENLLTYWQLFYQSIRAGSNPDISLGYVGGFVARASSVGISLFIPLLVNNYFITSGRCKLDDPGLVKIECREAYLLAAKLTGVSQLIALILAPAYGYFSDTKYKRTMHIPLFLAAISGIIGYSALSFLVQSPDPTQQDGSSLIYLWVSLIGASQIGAIVCSLGSISQGIAHSSTDNHLTPTTHLPNPNPSSSSLPSTIDPRTEPEPDNETEIETEIETAPLLLHNTPAPAPSATAHLPPPFTQSTQSLPLRHLQGSIAGTYSLSGGVGILFLTKVGGALFDSTSVAAPFVIMLGFNGLLLAAVLGHAGVLYRSRMRVEG